MDTKNVGESAVVFCCCVVIFCGCCCCCCCCVMKNFVHLPTNEAMGFAESIKHLPIKGIYFHEIAFVGHEDDRNGFAVREKHLAVNVVLPFLRAFECLQVCHVKDHYSCQSFFVVHPCQRPKTFLTCAMESPEEKGDVEELFHKQQTRRQTNKPAMSQSCSLRIFPSSHSRTFKAKSSPI